MKKLALGILAPVLLVCIVISQAYAHFGMVIPSDQMIVSEGESTVTLNLMFAHPVEKVGLELEKPAAFGVVLNGKTYNLLDSLKPVKKMGTKAWFTTYQVKRPGIYAFYMEPQPYFEPAEDCYITHYTKVILSAYGLEDGWDKEIGLKTEIVPLARPYGLYAGNTFQGIVKVKGKAVPYATVEVEYFDDKDQKKQEPLNEYMITQVVKADSNGVFTYALPKAGWWGFAALNTDDQQLNGKDVEIGAVIWVNCIEIR